MGFLEDLATQLNTAGVGVYPGTSSTRTIYISEMPDIPDACICLYPRAGRGRIFYAGGGEIRRPDLHIEARAATYSAAQTKIEAVCAALIAIVNTTIGSTYYLSALPVSEMISLGKDSRNRSMLAQNFEVKRVN